MPNPDEQSQQEIHEGTEALQAIADDVEAEREQAGRKVSLPDDDTPEDDGETREDHQAEAGDPLTDDEVGPMGYGRLDQQGGTIRP